MEKKRVYKGKLSNLLWILSLGHVVAMVVSGISGLFVPFTATGITLMIVSTIMMSAANAISFFVISRGTVEIEIAVTGAIWVKLVGLLQKARPYAVGLVYAFMLYMGFLWLSTDETWVQAALSIAVILSSLVMLVLKIMEIYEDRENKKSGESE